MKNMVVHQPAKNILLAPLLAVAAFACSQNHLAAEEIPVSLVNDSRDSAAEQVVSFGEVFTPGAVRPGDHLKIRFGQIDRPAQLDAKALYPDGSVRHGVVSVLVPKVAGGARLDGILSGGSATADLGPDPALPDFKVHFEFKGIDKTDVKGALDVDLKTLRPLESHADWLKGALVSEQRYAGPIFNGVQAVLDVRRPRVGPASVDLEVHNDSGQNPTIDTRTYSVAVSINGRTVYQKDVLKHYSHSNWHKLFFSSDDPRPRILPNLARLERLGAVPNYAPIHPSPEAEHALAKDAIESWGPLRSGSVTKEMGTTGGRADIGPLPTWAVFYLLDPSKENSDALFANADAAGSVPWHVRDMKDMGPISIDEHPDVWLDDRGEATPPVLARGYYIKDTDWAPDDAHEPSLTYLPYLLTGERYFLDELEQQASYVLLSYDPEFREGAKGVLMGSEVRGIAWGLRSLANAAYVVPSNDRLRDYFRQKFDNNLKEIEKRYVSGKEIDPTSELKGFMVGDYGEEGATAPWQSDYMVMILGWSYQMGFTETKPVLEWMTNFVAGRFISGDKGYDPICGTAYYIYVYGKHSDTMLKTWKEAYVRTFHSTGPDKELNYPEWGGGYAALARASLANIISVTGSVDAQKAYRFVVDHTPKMEANYPEEPTFAILPYDARPVEKAAKP